MIIATGKEEQTSLSTLLASGYRHYLWQPWQSQGDGKVVGKSQGEGDGYSQKLKEGTLDAQPTRRTRLMEIQSPTYIPRVILASPILTSDYSLTTMDDQELMKLARDYGVDLSDYDDGYADDHQNTHNQVPQSTRHAGYYDEIEDFTDDAGT